jgi:hypothetical protein
VFFVFGGKNNGAFFSKRVCASVCLFDKRVGDIVRCSDFWSKA